MKSPTFSEFKPKSIKGALALFILLFFNAGLVLAQPITVIIQTPDGAREVCQGSGTFILTAFAEGGNQNFIDYQWTAAPGVINPQGDYAIFNNSFATAPGDYLVGVTVFDSEGNSGSANITITLKATPTVSITADGPTTFCFGESVDLIADPEDGFQYNWRKGIADIPGEEDFMHTATESGSYRVRITGENGCFSLSNAITVTVLELPDVSASNSGPVCEGSDLQLIGGVDGLAAYYWGSLVHTSFISNEQSPIIPSITTSQAGEYFIIVTGYNGCQNSAATIVNVLELPVSSVSATSSHNNICSGAEGSLTLTANGGSGENLVWFTGGCNVTEIGQGNNLVIPFPTETTTYYVRWETSNCGNSDCVSVTVTVNETPLISLTSEDISCNGENDGSATVNISNGTPPYSILWSNGATSNSITGLSADTYSVTVTDDNGCQATAQVTITEPDVINITLESATEPSCNGDANGEIEVNISGGTPPYTLNWSNGLTDPSISGLTAGDYILTVTDDNGCTGSISVTLTEPDPLTVEAVLVVNVTSNGQSTGSLTVQGFGGTEPYTYVWDHGPTGPTVQDLSAGFYTVTVTDANGCTATFSFEITEPDPIIIDINGGESEICNPDNTGPGGVPSTYQINAIVLGGSGDFTYFWTSEPEDPSLVGQETIPNPLVSPTVTTVYTLYVVDVIAPEYQFSGTITITVLPQIIANPGEDATICHPENAGSHMLGQIPPGSGGTGTLSYFWSAQPADPSLAGQENLANPVVSPTQTTVYTLLVVDENGCEQSQEVTITVLNEFFAEASVSGDLCHPNNGGEVQLLATATGGSAPYSFLWAPADGLSNPGIANPTASPAINTTYVVTITDQSGCQATAEVEVELAPELFADAGNDITTCFGVATQIGGSPSATGGSGSGYTYQWAPATGLSNPNLPNPTVLNPTQSQTYTLTVTDSNGCVATDQVTINIYPQVFADAGQNQTVCRNSEVTLGGNPTATGGQAPYSYYWWILPNTPVSNQPNPVVTVTNNTEYYLTVTDANGCFNGSSVSITIEDNPVANAGPDQAICEGQTATLTASGGNSYLWSTGATTATIEVSPTETTTYSVTVSNSCGNDTDEVTIVVNPLPLVDLGDDIELCEGSEIILDAGFFEGASYLWSTGETTQSITISESGTYSLTVTYIASGCSSFDQIDVSILPIPLADAGDDQTICLGEETIIGPAEPTPSPASSYLWTSNPEDPSISDPTVINPTVSPTQTTVYTLTETFSDTGCQNQNSITVTVVGEAPDPGLDQTICQGESVTLGPETINPGSTYYWTSSNPEEVFDDQVPNPVVTPIITTTYTIFEQIGECVFSASVTITVNPAPEADAGTDKDICIGESVVIGPEDFEPSPASSFIWSSVPFDASLLDPTVTNPLVSPQVTTVYTLTETYTLTGCSSQQSITVTVHNLPELLIAENTVICQGETVYLGHPDAPLDYTYSWTSDPAGFISNESNPLVSPSQTTTFFATITTQFGCEISGQVTISVNPVPMALVADDVVFCNEDEVIPVFIGAEAIGGYTYQWISIPAGFSSNEANPLVTHQGSGTIIYQLTVTNEFGCTATASMQISFSDLAISTSIPTVCSDQETLVISNYIQASGGLPPYLYEWFDSNGNFLSDNPVFVALSPLQSSYMVVVTDISGCASVATIQVDLIPTPEVELLVSPPGTAYVGQTIIFTAMPSNFEHYEFFVDGVSVQAGAINFFTSAELHNGQIVTVIATNLGCTASSEPYSVSVSGLPNAFTPDGDEINDIFGKGHQLTIFNRWGQAVYEGDVGWDGKHNGKYVSPGTYYYIMEYFDHNNEKHVLKGSVTVIRYRN